MRRLLFIWCLLLAGIGCISQSEAFWQSRDSNYDKKTPSGGAAPVTGWNASDAAPGITVSTTTSTNDTATSSTVTCQPASTGICGVRAVNNHATGKYYFTIVYTNIGVSANDECAGITDNTSNLAANLGAQDSTMLCVSGTIVNDGNGGTCTSPGAFTAGDTVQVAIDLGASLAWFRVNSGNWNGNAGSNPVGSPGTLGCNLGILNSNAYPVTQLSNDANTTAVANFGATLSGYTQW